MTTIGGMVNAAATPRGVQLYTPTPQTPVARGVSPSKRTTPAKGKTPAPKFDAIDQQFMASPAELAKRQQVQAQEHPPDLPWWQDALGFGANVMSPLTVPGKVVTFGLEQAVRHLPDPVRRFMQDPVSYATPDSWEKNKIVNAFTEGGDAVSSLVNPFFGQDVAKVDADKRSFFNKIAPRSSYGSEAIYQDIDVPGLTGARNLALDIGHDPLTFVAGGERVITKGAEAGAEAATAARATETAAKTFDQATEAYAKTLQQSGSTWLSDNLAKITDKAAADLSTATSRQAAAEAAFENTARVTHAPATVGQRASFIAELLGRQPELVQFKDEFAKGISRGFGRMSPEAREAIDMAPRALRIAGTDVRLPFTGKLVEGAGALGSGLRAGTGKIGEYLPEALRDFRTPETVAEARKALRSKSTSPEMYQLYSDYIRIANDVRLGSGEMTQRGARAVNREWKNTFSKMTEGERDALRVAAEASPDANKVNDLMIKLAEIHEKITGRPFEDLSSINKNQYLPHIQSKEWAKWLKEHPDDPRAVAYKAATDFKTRDMLHTSGFVDRARQLRLAPGETSKEIDIGGRTMRLNGNTLNDLNEGLAKVFPEFEGKFYETNLDTIFHTYSDALARDAGSRRAFRNLAESASPHGRVVEGELADTLDKMNEALTQQSTGSRLRKMVEDRGGKFTPGETLSVPERPLVPGSKADQTTLRYWHEYNANVADAIATQDWQRVDSLVDEASKQKLSRTGMEVLGKDQTTAGGFTKVRLDDGSIIQVPDATVARGGGENIPAEHLSILQPRVSDRATEELTQWANSGVPTSFAGQSNIEGAAVRKQILSDMTDIRKNAYDGLRNEVSASSARIKSLREVADEYIAKIKGIGKVDRNNAAEVTQLRESMEKNVIDLENEIKARNSVWKGKGTREANKIDKELNRQLRVLKAHSENLDRKMAELPAEIRKEIKWRREQLFKPVEDAKADVRQSLEHFRMRNPMPYSGEEITWALETEAAADAASQGVARPAVDTAAHAAEIERLRDNYREVIGEMDDLRKKLDGKPTPETRAKIEAALAAKGQQAEGIAKQHLAARSNPPLVAEAAHPPLYHGTSKMFPEGRLEQGSMFGRHVEDNLVGPGFYSTDSPEIGMSYTSKGKGVDPAAYSVHWKGDEAPRILDFREPLPPDAADAMRRMVEGIGTNGEFDPAPVLHAIENGTGYDAYSALRQGLSDAGVLKNDANEIIGQLNEALADNYDAIVHEGGVRGGRKHTVYVWLNEGNVEVKLAHHPPSGVKLAVMPSERDLARAKEINQVMGIYEEEMKAAVAPAQKRYNQAIEQMRRQPEALVYTPTKSARYLHDEAGRFGSMVTPREDIFQGRRVEPVTTPPQPGAFKLDVPGITDPTPGAGPSIHPTAETRAVPRGMEGVRLRKQGVGPAGDVHIASHSVQLPPQRLEEEALRDLERLANSPQQSSMGRYAANQREAARIAEDTLPTRIANAQAVAAKENEVGRLTEVLPKEAALDRTRTTAQKLSDLEPIVHELSQEVDTRGQLRVLRDQYKSLPLGSKKVDIDATIRDLQQFNANNMLLDDATRKATDDLLKQFTTESQRIAGNRDVINGLGKMARDARSGKLKDEYLTGLADGWKGLHDGPVQRGDFIMDERLRAMLQRAEKTIDDPKLFGRLFNEATNVFKTYATLSPSFHVRNAISGIFMNAADGVSLANQLDGWKMVRAFKKDGEEWLARQEPEVQEAFRIMGGSGGGGRFAEAGFAGRHDKTLLNKVTRNRVTLLSQRAGEQVEQSLRLGMALDSVRNGMNAHNALERISRIHFDYSQLSKLDETMKRIIPFWTFMSRNLPLQMQMLYTMPKAYSAYAHFKQNFSAPDAPFTPSYWSNLGAFNTGGTVGGMPLYLQPDMGIDQAQQQMRQIKDIAGGDWGQLLSQANPLVVGPAQAMFKKDLYRDRNFGPADYSKAEGPLGSLIAALARVVPGQTKTVDGQTLVSDNFTNLVTKLIPPLNQAGRLAPQTTGDLGDTSRQAEAFARYLGIPIRTLSPKQQEIEARNQFFDARDALSTQKSLRRRAAA